MDVQMPFTGGVIYENIIGKGFANIRATIFLLCGPVMLMGRLCTHVIRSRLLSLYFMFFFSGVVMSCCLRDLKRISL